MNKKIMIWALIWATVLTVWLASADMSWGFMKFGSWLTDTEKTQLASMTKEEKQVFIETKRAEMESKMEQRESIIDKIFAWETLTADEQIIKAEIIKNRAERKTQRAERIWHMKWKKWDFQMMWCKSWKRWGMRNLNNSTWSTENL